MHCKNHFTTNTLYSYDTNLYFKHPCGLLTGHSFLLNITEIRTRPEGVHVVVFQVKVILFVKRGNTGDVIMTNESGGKQWREAMVIDERIRYLP